jgi:uncharacterized RmlC-like cupin family protein
MSVTTLIKKRSAIPRKPLEQCHGGKGALDWIEVLDRADLPGRGLNFVHDDVLAPGVSIGPHAHQEDEEYYYIISGQGTMTLDHQRFEVAAGDITAVFPGGMHALENTGAEDRRILVFSVAGPAPAPPAEEAGDIPEELSALEAEANRDARMRGLCREGALEVARGRG